ncbi:hypothetical protein K449DRAFT_306300, partial [Hypoxylon sp. EC38]
ALSDLRSIRWARVGLWTLLAVWSIIILGLFIFLALYGPLSSDFESRYTACRSDGSFNIMVYEYNAWSASGFFEINLGFGNLTFTQAKVIDISWDIIIGRLGQILMAFISWRAFADYVTTSMGLAPVTYTTYFTMFLESEPSFFSTFRVVRAFISERGLKSRVSIIFIVWSMLFLIRWPTLASAMTGYTTLNKAFVPDNNGNYIPFSDFQPIAYIIHDGWRVNLTSDQVVSYFRSTYSNVSSNGFFGLRNTSSTWNSIYHLDSPVLNISAFYIDPRSGFHGFNWTDPRGAEYEELFTDPSNLCFTYSNQTYPLAYIKEKGACQPVQDQFEWGFSFIQAFFAVTNSTIWTVGTYIIWLKAQFQLPLQGQAETPRGWRAILILAENINRELRGAGIDAHSLTDRQLKKKIKNQLQGGTVSFEASLTRRGYSFRHGTRQWLRKERKWSFIFLFIL